MTDSNVASGGKGVPNAMEPMFWFIGAVVFYFALQLWILPKLGIST